MAVRTGRRGALRRAQYAVIVGLVVALGGLVGVIAAQSQGYWGAAGITSATGTSGGQTGSPPSGSEGGHGIPSGGESSNAAVAGTATGAVTPTAGVTLGATASMSPGATGSPGPAGELTASFAALVKTLPVQSIQSDGVVVAPLGSTDAPVVLGGWTSGPAWSTMKVPLAEAALAQDPKVLSTVRSAITTSNNAAAESLWSTLGSGTTAAAKVDAVLAAHGDSVTHTQANRIRPPYSAFGQKQWALTQQVRFAQGIACSSRSAPVVNLMGQVTESQRWGLGNLTAASYKGG